MFKCLVPGLCLFALLGACAKHPRAAGPTAPMPPAVTPHPLPFDALLPLPATLRPGAGAFAVGADTRIIAATQAPQVLETARLLEIYIRQASGLTIPITADAAGSPALRLAIDAALPEEGYRLNVAPDGLSLTGGSAAGVFYGFQTLRQLMPAAGEYEAILYRNPQPFTIPAVQIDDAPRYAWRGAMLDVSRHFFSVEDVKRFIDLLALHKMNRLHLGLSNDQGWRIEIKSRPNLTTIGAATEVGGTPGGFYTQEQYRDLVAYAAMRFVTVVPEIDMPGHTNAALASYAELNCNDVAPAPFTGTAVGFSAFCVDRESTYAFIDDIVREIAALTPGPYFHLGGDEVKTLTPAQYTTFVNRVQQIVSAHGKQAVGWDEIATSDLLPTTIVQHWRPKTDLDRLARAAHVILSPGDRTYLDMKYHDGTLLGLTWAGLIPIRQSYDWDPATLVPGLAADRVLGVEAPLWSETLGNIRDVEYLAFPRAAALAEVAWSPAARDWEAFRVRLGAQAPRWTALGINFYRDPSIDWRP